MELKLLDVYCFQEAGAPGRQVFSLASVLRLSLTSPPIYPGGVGVKSKLMDFLPAPKNEDLSQALGGGMAAGSGAAGRGRGLGSSGRTRKGGYFDDDDEDDPVLAAGFGDGGAAAVGLSNEAFRAPADEDEEGGDGSGAAPTGSWSQHPSAAYAQSAAAGPSTASRAPVRNEFDLPAELAGVQFKEVGTPESISILGHSQLLWHSS